MDLRIEFNRWHAPDLDEALALAVLLEVEFFFDLLVGLVLVVGYLPALPLLQDLGVLVLELPGRYLYFVLLVADRDCAGLTAA